MSNNNEYFISKLSFRDDEQLIRDVCAYSFDGNDLSEGETRTRSWLVNRTIEGVPLSTMTKNDKGLWSRGNRLTYDGSIFTWGCVMPKNLERRKTFVSYYHKDDQPYRERFETMFGDLLVSKSVEDGDIDSDNSADYIKQLIQGEYLSDTTVLVVLIGSKTKCRKHVDWEISGALDYKVGDSYSGLLGLFLPTHPDFGSDQYHHDLVPARLAANFKSGYAIARDWTDDRVKIQGYIEQTFSQRSNTDAIKNREIAQMTYNTCE